jgi:hypothetical protein
MTIAELKAELTVLDIDGTNLKHVIQGYDDVELSTLTGIVGEVEIVHEEGDTEGGGDHSEVVVHFKDHNIFLRATGFYSSYNGTEWDSDLTEVEPYEKMVTFYKNK